MIDIKTGRFSWGEGKELYPGMKREDFEKSILYQQEVSDEYKKNPEKYSCCLKPQTIDGFEMFVRLTFDFDTFLSDITMSRPDHYLWPDWPKDKSEDEIHREIKDHNDRFLATQFQGQIEGGRELWFDFDWGKISSTFSYMHDPVAEIHIDYDLGCFNDKYVDDGRPIAEIIDDIYNKK